MVIGGGSAGLLAAAIAPKMGARTALIERARLGGDCLWTGCVPSKAMLASARAAHTIRRAGHYGLDAAEPRVDTAKVWQRIRQRQQAVDEADDYLGLLRDAGAEVILGEASFVDEHTVRAGDRMVTTKYVLVCTGSRPAAPPIEGLEDAGYLTSETVFELERAPGSLIVIGAGPVGVEMAQGLNRLGVQTTLVELAPRILEREEPALSAALLSVLRDEGVDAHLNVRPERATREEGGKALHGTVDGVERTWAAEEIFVATGRKASIEPLGLDRIGVETNARGIVVDRKLRSSVPSVYAAGDCAGRYLFTHSASAEASTALRNMFYPGSASAPEPVPWATFSDPELARVGLTSVEARAALGDEAVRTFEADFAHNDRALADGATQGKMVVVTDAKLKVLGAHILAPAASEMIGQWTLAVSQGARLSPTFRDLVQVYPTFSSSFLELTEQAVYEQLDRPLIRAARRLNETFGI